MLDTFHDWLRWSHIGVGFACLVLFWIPTLAKKGGRLHIRAGKIFVAAAYFMTATAFISCTWALISPSSFARFRDTLSAERVRELELEIRFFFVILLVLASWILMSLTVGISALRVRQDPLAMTRGIVRPSCWLAIAINAAAVIFGAYHWMQLGQTGYIVPIVLGVIGCGEASKHLQFARDPFPTKMAWWYKHMDCMLGTGVGFYTAFIVFGSSRLFEVDRSHWTSFIPWIVPTLIGAPVTLLWIRYYKKKFGELTAKKAVEVNTEKQATL